MSSHNPRIHPLLVQSAKGGNYYSNYHDLDEGDEEADGPPAPLPVNSRPSTAGSVRTSMVDSMRSSLFRTGASFRAQTSFMDNRLKDAMESLKGHEEEDDEHTTIETLRLDTKEFLEKTFFGEIYSQFLLVVSILSCLRYIQLTYQDDYPSDSNSRDDVIEMIVACLFTMDWCLNLFIADHRGLYLSR